MDTQEPIKSEDQSTKPTSVPFEVVSSDANTAAPTVETEVSQAEIVDSSSNEPRIEDAQSDVELNVEPPTPVEVTAEEETTEDVITTTEVEASDEVDATDEVDAPDEAATLVNANADEANGTDNMESSSSNPTAKPDATADQPASPADEFFVEDEEDKSLVEAFHEEETVMPFMEMGLAPVVLEAIKSAGYETPSPIQTETVPYIVEGHDLIGQAETGSGKTAAFAWPILSKLDLSSKKTQCLILAPTRELAIQVTSAFRKYASAMPGFRTTTIYGGQSYETQFRALQRGAHVVAGTPGRVIDHLSRGTLDLSGLKVFVLDEADEMLRMGFVDDVEQVLKQTPRTQQTLFFSATMPPAVRRIAETYLRDPVHVKIESKTATADSIVQSCIFVEPREKQSRLVRFLETEETDGVLVFVKTRNTTNVVAEKLIQNGFIASSLNGDIPQNQRERTVGQLKSGKINVVVATDVAARGLDVSRISHVINYDFPHDTESYIHRIGRTGRAGRTGNAILFVEPKEKGKLSRLQRSTNQKIDTFQQKSLKEINEIRVAKFKQQIIEAAEHKDMPFFTEIVEQLQSEAELSVEQIAAALAVVAQGDTPLKLEALKSPKSNWRKEREGKGGRNRDHGPMQTFRVEVGRSDGVGPGNLVGAITNEANLTNADIGRIRLFDRFSTIDLPADLPGDMIEHLSNVFVSGKPLQITRSDETYSDDRRGSREGRGRPRQGGGNRYGGNRGGYRGRSDSRDGGGRRNDSRGSYGSRDRNDSRGGNRSRDGQDSRGSYRSRDGQDSRSGYRSRDGQDSRGSYRSRDGQSSRQSDEHRGGRSSRDDRSSSDRSRGDRSRGGYQSRGKNEARGERREGRSDFKPRGERASKPTKWNRDDRRKDRSEASDKPKRKKTKAALRTKARAKPGAKLDGPIKKYVKIRSSKKK
ncbi:MAG: DEAD/DEAH box helicase [Planctomycetota bacterium]